MLTASRGMGASAMLGVALVASYGALAAVALNGFGAGGLLGLPGRAVDAIVQVNAAPFTARPLGGYGNPQAPPPITVTTPVVTPSQPAGGSPDGAGTGGGGGPQPIPGPGPQPGPGPSPSPGPEPAAITVAEATDRPGEHHHHWNRRCTEHADGHDNAAPSTLSTTAQATTAAGSPPPQCAPQAARRSSAPPPRGRHQRPPRQPQAPPCGDTQPPRPSTPPRSRQPLEAARIRRC